LPPQGEAKRGAPSGWSGTADPSAKTIKLWSDCALRIFERVLASAAIARAVGFTRPRHRGQRALRPSALPESFFGSRNRARRRLAVHSGSCTLARRLARSGSGGNHGVNATLRAVNLKRARSGVAGHD
jgi:hypothetical protein